MKIRISTNIKAVSFLILVFIFSCSPTEPEEKKDPEDSEYEISITSENVGLMDMTIKVSLNEIPPDNLIEVIMGDSIIVNETFLQKEKTFFIDDLEPGTEYVFFGKIFLKYEQKDTTLTVFETLDTTDRPIITNVFDFPEYNFYSANMNEIVITDKKEIYIACSVALEGQAPDFFYSVMIYRNNEWSFDTVKARHTLISEKKYYPLNFMQKLPDKTLVAGTSGTLLNYTDDEWHELLVIHGNPNRIWDCDSKGLWGTSLNNLYLSCTNGIITKYDGNDWSEMHIAGNYTLDGITGTDDGKNIFTFYNEYGQDISGIYHYNWYNWDLIYDYSNIEHKALGKVNDIELNNDNLYILSADDRILKYIPEENYFKILGSYFSTGYEFRKFSVQAENNIYVCGDEKIFHFNGDYVIEIIYDHPGVHFLEIDSYQNIFVAVGVSSSYPYPPVIVIGYK